LKVDWKLLLFFWEKSNWLRKAPTRHKQEHQLYLWCNIIMKSL